MEMLYAQCGNSGLFLPKISLGLWHNFGGNADFPEAEKILRAAFDCGITHFDLANNYGPPPGSAEENFGKTLRGALAGHRDEIVVSTKAGHRMWNGPYGDGCSRKSIIASCDQSLRRTGLDYFDIFYAHRFDGVTPVEETMSALSDLVRAGKALYVGISKFPPEAAERACAVLRGNGTPCLVFQDRYSLFERSPEARKLALARENGAGFIAFSPLAQGLLTEKYLRGIPAESRAASPDGFLKREQVTDEKVAAARKLAAVARERGQTLAQTAIAWLLRNPRVTSVLIGARTMRAKDVAAIGRRKKADDATEASRLSGRGKTVYGRYAAHFSAGVLGAWLDVFLRERYDALVVFSDFRDGIRQRRDGKTVFADSSYAPADDARTPRERRWEADWLAAFARSGAPKLYLFSVRATPQDFLKKCVEASGGEVSVLDL